MQVLAVTPEIFPLIKTGGLADVTGALPIALAPLGLVLVAIRLRLDGDGLTAVLAMALLVALVGGRIVPAFLAARAGSRASRPPLPRGAASRPSASAVRRGVGRHEHRRPTRRPGATLIEGPSTYCCASCLSCTAFF